MTDAATNTGDTGDNGGAGDNPDALDGTATATELARSTTLWELITRRAALTPDTTVLIEAAEGARG